MCSSASNGRLRRRSARLLTKLIQSPRVLLYRFLSTAHIEGRPTCYQPLQAVGAGEIHFSGMVRIGVFPSPLFFSTYAYLEARASTARISIGAGTWLNNGFSAIAEHTSITIGQRVLMGTNVEIVDSDFHGLLVEDRCRSLPAWARPVIVEDDVFIGSNVKVMKGVTIGRGAVIANGAVVVKDIPAGVIAGGNPARVIRAL